MQPWLLRLRRVNKTVLLVDHAGRGGIAARGTSKREDVLDTIIHLKRPSDYEPDQGARFEVHLEKARGVYGDDAKPFEAQLETIDGADHWHVKSLEDANADRVIEATKEGLSSREIAKELGVSKSTVNNIRRRHKFKVIDGGKDVATGHPLRVMARWPAKKRRVTAMTALLLDPKLINYLLTALYAANAARLSALGH